MRAKIHIRTSVYFRVLVLTTVVILVFYAIGLYLNSLGRNNVTRDLERSILSESSYMVEEMERELVNLVQMEQEYLSDALLLRLAITYDVMSDYRRTEAIRNLADSLARIKRFSSLTDTALSYLPQIDVCIFATSPILDSLDEALKERLLGFLLEGEGQVFEYEGRIILTNCFPYRGKAAPLCVVALTFTPDTLLARMSGMRNAPENQIALLRADGSVYAGMPDAFRLLSDLPISGIQYQPAMFVSKGIHYMAMERPIEMLGLRCVYFTSIENALGPVIEHRIWIWVLTSLAALLLVIYLMYFRKAVFHPLNTIYGAMARMQKGNDFVIPEHSNEFETIYEQFGQMIARIERLAGEVYEEKIRAQQAEIMQLQMQIRPHFFYNTLFIIYRMAQREGNEDIALLSNHLSSYYAYITRSPKDEVPLEDEIRHVSDYLEIQRVRFGRRIDIAMDLLPPALSRERIPPLVIQPLVENAFEHGLHDKAQGGRVHLAYEYDHSSFRVIVSDNGDQMNDRAVEQLREALEQGTLREGSALYNLNRRLRLRYGEGFGLVLSSEHNGLRASVSFQRRKVDGREAE